MGSGRASLTAELWGGVPEGEQAGKEQGTKTAREEQGARAENGAEDAEGAWVVPMTKDFKEGRVCLGSELGAQGDSSSWLRRHGRRNMRPLQTGKRGKMNADAQLASSFFPFLFVHGVQHMTWCQPHTLGLP